MHSLTTNLSVGGLDLSLSWEGDDFQTSLRHSRSDDGADLVHIHARSDTSGTLPSLQLAWSIPVVDIEGCWHPQAGRNKGLSVDWGRPFISKATSSAPVVCLYNSRGHNRLTFALSDALRPVSLRAGVHEETATIRCSVTLFEPVSTGPADKWETSDPSQPTSYEAVLRLDAHDVPYHEVLRAVAQWWAKQPGYTPSPVPEIARLPMYSTWYSFHQQLSPEAVEEQCRLARELGCEAVIVDDGWQTANNERGYAYCGDWEPAQEKLPHIRAHVARVHQLGLKYLLWYSVPFVGIHSHAWSRFSNKLLGVNERLGTGVLDPRYPEVREFLIQTYETALREWDLDGVKLDFVDSFNPSGDSQEQGAEGRDYSSVPEAVDRLLTDTMIRLRSIKPDVMVEFRQSYIGPLMRKYGNMFRAGDCPNDAVENRVRTLDIRLLSGNTPAHSDMTMWHPDEPPEIAALQLLNVLFSVPQVSVMLDRVPQAHVEMLRFWLAFWREQRDVLLDGLLCPLSPTLLYPAVLASNEYIQIGAVYGPAVLPLPSPSRPTIFLVNGTLEDRLVCEVKEDAGPYSMRVSNCQGALIREETFDLRAGVHSLQVPPAGLAEMRTIARS